MRTAAHPTTLCLCLHDTQGPGHMVHARRRASLSPRKPSTSSLQVYSTAKARRHPPCSSTSSHAAKTTGVRYEANKKSQTKAPTARPPTGRGSRRLGWRRRRSPICSHSQAASACRRAAPETRESDTHAHTHQQLCRPVPSSPPSLIRAHHAPRASQSRTQSWAPRRWRRQGTPPGKTCERARSRRGGRERPSCRAFRPDKKIPAHPQKMHLVMSMS